MSPSRVYAATIAGAAMLVLAAPARAAEVPDPATAATIRASKRVTAVSVDTPIAIDGALDEPAWKTAQPAAGFVQQQPAEGAPSSEPTEVRFLYDHDTLYVGATLYDTDPRGPISNEMKRDFSARDGDVLVLVLDTFHDQRNAFSFQINPAGAERDTQSYDDGRQINADWDGAWRVKTGRFAGGWTVELAIPFKTLRFDPAADQTWGLNIFRMLRRRNEPTMWAPVPRQFTQFKVSYAGTLEGLAGIRPGRNLRIKPFVTAGVSRGGTGARAWNRDGGLDVKYGIKSALTLDLTYRTDFSQVEADAQQVNLTRFSLFLPEKRDFFLENQGAFRIGDIDQQTGARSPVIPFFSRRIGLDAQGGLVPIVGGARLSGREGAYTVGLLNMQTASTALVDAGNYSAFRVGRDLGVGSSMSGFYLGRESQGRDPFNRVVGGDVHLNFRRTIDLDAFAMRSADAGRQGSAGRAVFAINENRYKLYGAYTNVQPSFRNDLGFVPRGDIGSFSWDAKQNFRPRAARGWLRNLAIGPEGDAYETSNHATLVSRVSRLSGAADFSDGGKHVSNLDWDYERLTAPFEISKGVTLPAGEYRFRQISHQYTSVPSHALSGSVKLTTGEFYSGTLKGLDTSLRLRVNANFAASVSYSHNAVSLREGAFTRDLVGVRADHSFTTHMWLNAFIQYNQASGTWLTNVRYRYMYRPLSDLFLVYNETRAAGHPPQRAVVLKYTILAAF